MFGKGWIGGLNGVGLRGVAVAGAILLVAEGAASAAGGDRGSGSYRDRCEAFPHRPAAHRAPVSRHDPYGWYGSTSPWPACGKRVTPTAEFGPTIAYDRFGRECDAYPRPTPFIAHAGCRTYGPYYRYRTSYGSGPWYDGPSTRYRLVEVDPELAASRVRASGPHSAARSGSAYRAWQAEVRERGAALTDDARASTQTDSHANAQANTPAGSAAVIPSRPGPASVSKSPTAAQRSAGAQRVLPDPPMSEPLTEEEVRQAWSALEAGRFLEALALFARGADAPVMPGSADHRAVFSAGYAVAASMLSREEAASWALRRAGDLDPGFPSSVPWTDALRERVRQALRRVLELNDVQPTPERAGLARMLRNMAE